MCVICDDIVLVVANYSSKARRICQSLISCFTSPYRMALGIFAKSTEDEGWEVFARLATKTEKTITTECPEVTTMK